jgi:F0F1-type ATP synthase membrane subunit b/b'
MEVTQQIFGNNIWFALSYFFAGITIVSFIYAVLHMAKHDHQEHDDMRQYRHIVDKAHKQARSLLYATSLASEEILQEVHTTSENIDENLDKIMQSMVQKHINYLSNETDTFNKSYAEKLKTVQDQLNKTTEQLLKNSEERVNASLTQFIQPIQKQVSDAQNKIDTHTKELLEQTEKELADYKATRIAAIEKQVKDLVNKTYRDVLHQSIPESFHEDLILKSLEQAKTENLFDL